MGFPLESETSRYLMFGTLQSWPMAIFPSTLDAIQLKASKTSPSISFWGNLASMVIHHDFCSDGCVRLVQFIDQLNALKVSLTWRPLGDLVKRSYRQKEISPDCVEIEMYGSELLIENGSDRAKSYFVSAARTGVPILSKAFIPNRAGYRGILLEITSGAK